MLGRREAMLSGGASGRGMFGGGAGGRKERFGLRRVRGEVCWDCGWEVMSELRRLDSSRGVFGVCGDEAGVVVRLCRSSEGVLAVVVWRGCRWLNADVLRL